LWETTLDTEVRSLLQVKVNHADSAEESFSTLIGDARSGYCNNSTKSEIYQTITACPRKGGARSIRSVVRFNGYPYVAACHDRSIKTVALHYCSKKI
jgi:hypothetical protein